MCGRLKPVLVLTAPDVYWKKKAGPALVPSAASAAAADKKKRKRQGEAEAEAEAQAQAAPAVRGMKILKKFQIRLIPVIAADAFPAHKLAPTRNAVRSAAAGDSDAALLPTPLYNQMVLEDTALRSHLEEVYRCVTDCPEFATALQLFKVWLRQRSLRSDTQKMENAGL